MTALWLAGPRSQPGLESTLGSLCRLPPSGAQFRALEWLLREVGVACPVAGLGTVVELVARGLADRRATVAEPALRLAGMLADGRPALPGGTGLAEALNKAAGSPDAELRAKAAALAQKLMEAEL